MDNQNNQDPLNKINTCIHRSLHEEARLIKRCSCKGGNYYQKGYFCNARQIMGVTAQFCAECTSYESK